MNWNIYELEIRIIIRIQALATWTKHYTHYPANTGPDY